MHQRLGIFTLCKAVYGSYSASVRPYTRCVRPSLSLTQCECSTLHKSRKQPKVSKATSKVQLHFRATAVCAKRLHENDLWSLLENYDCRKSLY